MIFIQWIFFSWLCSVNQASIGLFRPAIKSNLAFWKEMVFSFWYLGSLVNNVLSLLSLIIFKLLIKIYLSSLSINSHPLQFHGRILLPCSNSSTSKFIKIENSGVVQFIWIVGNCRNIKTIYINRNTRTRIFLYIKFDLKRS